MHQIIIFSSSQVLPETVLSSDTRDVVTEYVDKPELQHDLDQKEQSQSERETASQNMAKLCIGAMLQTPMFTLFSHPGQKWLHENYKW